MKALKKFFNYLISKLKPKPKIEITPKGQCFLDYLVKIQSGEEYEHIQAYDDTIERIMKKNGYDKETAISYLKVVLIFASQQND